jgi:hypothetical protein
MKKLVKYLSVLLVGTMLIAASQVQAQPANLVLRDTTIATVATFTAINSITAGPNFVITGTGDATFVTGGSTYLRNGIVIIQGGRLRTISDSVTVDVRMPDAEIPAAFSLHQNYPNPFNPSTTIKYDLPKDSRVSLKLFNILGQEVETIINEDQMAGYKSVEWNASNVTSGVYFYRIHAGDFVASKKLLFLK